MGAREEKERALKEAKEATQKSIDEAKAAVEATDAAIKKVEEHVTPAEVAKTFSMSAVEMTTLCDTLDAAAAEAKESSEGATAKITALSEDVEDHLKDFVVLEARRLTTSTGSFEARLNKVTAAAGKIRAEAQKKNSTELEALRTKVIDMIKHHQKEKGLDNAGMFKEVAKSGKVGEAEFMKFIKSCEKKKGENGDAEVPSDDDLSG